MTSCTFQYSLKVWLTSVVIAPLLFIIFTYGPQVDYCRNLQQVLSSGLFYYVFFACLELAFSLLTWLVFLLVIQLVTMCIYKPIIRRLLICIAGISLTIGNFMIVLSPRELLNFGDGPATIVLFNCLCIGGGVWYYKMEPTVAVL